MNNQQQQATAHASRRRAKPQPGNVPAHNPAPTNGLQAAATLAQIPRAGSHAQRQAALLQLQRTLGNAHVQRRLHPRRRSLQREPAEAGAPEAQTEATTADEDWLASIFAGGSAALAGVVDVIDSAADSFSDLVSGFWTEETTPEAAPGTDAPVAAEPVAAPLEAGAAALAEALAQGERNANVLTDIVFYARYPERRDKPINPQTEKDIVALWQGIRSSEVKPALAGPVPEGPQPAGPTPEPAAPVAQPDPGALAPLLAQLAAQEQIQEIETIVTTLTGLQTEIDSQSGDKSTAEQKEWNKKLWKAIADTSLHKLYKEGSDDQVDQMTTLLGDARGLVNGLTTAALQDVAPEVTDVQTAQIIGYYHRHLNTLTPFFTQMANMNILHKGSSDAWKRTCNVTSLSMVLLSLGVGADAFSGDKELLASIAAHFVPELATWESLLALRMPDFVQFVAVYTAYKDGPEEGFAARVDSARDTVAPRISTTLDIFTEIVQHFGVSRVHSSGIDSQGTAKRKNEDLDPDNQLNPADFTTAQFKADVTADVTPWVNQGGQIIVNRPGHYLRLQAIDDSGVTFDDPGDEGKNFHVTWAESNGIGHFRSYQVFKKG